MFLKHLSTASEIEAAVESRFPIASIIKTDKKAKYRIFKLYNNIIHQEFHSDDMISSMKVRAEASEETRAGLIEVQVVRVDTSTKDIFGDPFIIACPKACN